jgi:hypothetical protein
MSTSTIKVISVLGVASALIPLLGKAKSDYVKTAACAYWISILFTFGKVTNTTSNSNIALVFDRSSLSTMFHWV